MKVVDIDQAKRNEFNSVVNHPLQSYEWGEFREKTGVKVIRRGFETKGKLTDGFQLTIHKIPKTPYTIGYLPKGNPPTKEMLQELKRIGNEENCVFIQLEPNIQKKQNTKYEILKKNTVPSAHPLFTKYTFILDLTKSEEELLKNMHSKTRYNIRLADRKGVKINIDNSDEAFETYWKLTKETTTRQKFYAHTKQYHKHMWETLKPQNTEDTMENTNKLSAYLFTAEYQRNILTTWVLFTFRNALYYPYGASSSEHREVMANNLIMWEAIKFGKEKGLTTFDMWGALSDHPDRNDPWYGFHRFKAGYGPEHVEFVGSYDLVINSMLYPLYKVMNKLRWLYLRLKK